MEESRLSFPVRCRCGRTQANSDHSVLSSSSEKAHSCKSAGRITTCLQDSYRNHEIPLSSHPQPDFAEPWDGPETGETPMTFPRRRSRPLSLRSWHPAWLAQVRARGRRKGASRRIRAGLLRPRDDDGRTRNGTRGERLSRPAVKLPSPIALADEDGILPNAVLGRSFRSWELSASSPLCRFGTRCRSGRILRELGRARHTESPRTKDASC